MNKPYRILEFVSDTSSCSYYRNIMPTIGCRDDLRDHGIELTNFIKPETDPDEFDCYIFSRIPNPDAYLAIQNLFSSGRKIIWDIDDELWNVPEWNPHARHFTRKLTDWLYIYFNMATRIITSTENLRLSTIDKFKLDPKKVVTLENLVTAGDYDPFLNIEKKHSSTPFKIVWSGGDSHAKDVEPIKFLYDHYENHKKVNIIMFGYMPAEYKKFKPSRIIYMPFNVRKFYEASLTMLCPHVAIVPLVDHPFNKCKSAIKYYEMTLAGIPSIISDVSPYKDVVNSGKDALIVKEDSDWTMYCDMLMEDSVMWESLIENAMRNVITNYSWDMPNLRNQAWYEFFKSVPELEHIK